MPEDQNYNGDQWNTVVNNLLSRVLKWQQLGTSNIDVRCGPNDEAMGLDSVFAYRTHKRSYQQVVIVEAKNRDTFKALNKANLQEWVDRLLKKVEYAPVSRDFNQKFPTDDDAEFSVGLLAVWVRDTASFNAQIFADRLRQLEVPEKRYPILLYILDNYRITRFLAVYEEINRLLSTENYKNFVFYYPANGSDLICDGDQIPMEAMFSDILFYKTTKRQLLLGSNTHDEYDAAVCFYFGEIRTIADLRFIDLAIRDSGLQNSKSVEVYITTSTDDLRSEIDAHIRSSNFNIQFKRLSIRKDLPSWLGDQ